MDQHTTVSGGHLSTRHEAAVRALVRTLAPGSAAAERLALNRAAAVTLIGHAADLDRMVLDAARDAAAEHLEASTTPVRRGVIGRHRGTCAQVPRALAARAAGRLGADDVARLDRHLARCRDCKALAARFAAADIAAADSLSETQEEPRHDASVVWLADSSTSSPEAVTPDEPAAQDWALPDLRDEPAAAAPQPSGAAQDWLVPGAAPLVAAAQDAAAADAAHDWLAPGTVPTAGDLAEDHDPADWLIGDAGGSSAAPLPAEDTAPTDWLADDVTPVAPATAVAATAAAPPPRQPWSRRVGAVLPVALLLVGGGAVLAMASIVSTDKADAPPPPVAAVTTTASPPAAATARAEKAARERAQVRRRSERRAAARRAARRKAAARRRAAATAQAAAPARQSAPAVAQAPVVRQTPVTPVASQPVRRAAPKAPASSVTTQKLSTPAATNVGPSGAAPSSDPGRTIPGP